MRAAALVAVGALLLSGMMLAADPAPAPERRLVVFEDFANPE